MMCSSGASQPMRLPSYGDEQLATAVALNISAAVRSLQVRAEEEVRLATGAENVIAGTDDCYGPDCRLLARAADTPC